MKANFASRHHAAADFAAYLKRTDRYLRGWSLARLQRHVAATMGHRGNLSSPQYTYGDLIWAHGAVCRWNERGGYLVTLA